MGGYNNTFYFKREILHRGKAIDTGEWVEGNLIFSEKDNIYLIVNINKSKITYTAVNPETISENIDWDGDGIKTKIYNGDIILVDNWQKGYIFFDYGKTEYLVKFKEEDELENLGDILNGSSWEIIGNIFDNPYDDEKESKEED